MRSSSGRWLERRPELDAGQEVDRMGVQPVRGVERLVRFRVSGARANHVCDGGLQESRVDGARTRVARLQVICEG